MAIPTYKKLCNPILIVLHQKGGSSRLDELERAVADLIGLSASERNEKRSDGKSRLHHRIAWARFYLKKKGLLARVRPGMCALSDKGKRIRSI